MKRFTVFLFMFFALSSLAVAVEPTASVFPFRMKPVLGTRLDSAAQISDVLVGCWPFNGGGGNKVFDVSGNRNTGTLVGDTSWVPGKFGPCLSFDGTGDYISLNDTSALDITGSGLTIIAMIKIPANAGDYDRIIEREAGYPKLQYSFVLSPTTNRPILDLYLDGAIAPTSVATTGVPLNEWTFIAATYNGTIRQHYLNGIPNGSTATTGSITSVGATNPIIGAYGSGGGFDFNGQIDNVMIFNRALTASEIAQLYQAPFCMFAPEPSRTLYYLSAPPAGENVQVIIIASLPPLMLVGLLFLYTMRQVREMSKNNEKICFRS